jgi:hypothetical protein
MTTLSISRGGVRNKSKQISLVFFWQRKVFFLSFFSAQSKCFGIHFFNPKLPGSLEQQTSVVGVQHVAKETNASIPLDCSFDLKERRKSSAIEAGWNRFRQVNCCGCVSWQPVE